MTSTSGGVSANESNGIDAAADSLSPGQKFGARYSILKKLGSGGMGTVYKAWDGSLGVDVALKLIRSRGIDDHHFRDLEERFKRELLLARQVTHPNVVRIYDLGELGRTKYLTMAYVDGADLATVLGRDGPMPVPRALAIFKQIAEGLSAAHRLKIVHRDLKPANVMVTEAGQALLTDFGIAYSVDAAKSHDESRALVGTLVYMAPEQVSGKGTDLRTDVYALGLILYEMLVGGSPIVRPDTDAYTDLVARVAAGPEPLERVLPDLPHEIHRLAAKCLSQDPADRYSSANELLDDINRLAVDGTRLPETRNKWALVGATSLVIALLTVGAGLTGWFTATSTTPAAAHPPVQVLVANFDNLTKEVIFDGTLEDAVSTGLEGTPFVSMYSRPAAVRLAAKLRPGASLDLTGAQLVAVREELDVVVAGSIERAGRGYRVSARTVNPLSGETLSSTQEQAADQAAVLSAVSKIAAHFRASLGDATAPSEFKAESVTVGNLEALREYSLAQELTTDFRNEQAIEHYRKAIQHDPDFGRAYSGLALSTFDLGRREEAEELWKKALSLLDRMTERERYRTLGAYAVNVAGNYDQAIEAYSNLVEKYPADLAGQNNLAVAYFYTMNFAKAMEYGGRAIEVYPKSLKFRSNYALYSMYASDFATAAEHARKVIAEDAKYDAAYLPIAMAAMSGGEVAAAIATYDEMAKAGPGGASLAAIGHADAALYQGRPADAVAILEPAIVSERQQRNTYGVTTKTIALAEARAAMGEPAAATRLMAPLLTGRFNQVVAVPAARLLMDDSGARVRQLAESLESRSQPLPTAYARVITGEFALRQGRTADAIAQFTAAIKATDVWLARLNLGIAYVEAGRFAEAIAELEIAQKRRGEATALFLDDIPTYRYASDLPYWRGRAEQGLGMAAAASSFEQFLKLRGTMTANPLVRDARRRLDGLRVSPVPR